MSSHDTFRDLSTLARDRCRTHTELALQFLDTDQERAALMLLVATDLIYGAASFFDQPDRVQAAFNTMAQNLRDLSRKENITELRR